ncbi:MAG: FixH family protein [Nitrospinota bacterium]|nr:FixH family protein [Nitrospinota bacterium]
MNRYAIAAMALFAVALTACGSSDSGSSSGYNDTVSTASYAIEYSADAPPAMGKSSFTLKVKKAGVATPGLAVTLAPMMDMGGGMRSTADMGMTHGTPAEAVVDNGDGTYTCTLYYIMAGKWSLGVNVEGETATFMLNVAMAGKDTAMAKLSSQTKRIMALGGGMQPMPYFLFNEGMTGADTFRIFIAARQDMFTYPHIGGAHVEVSTDKASWGAMMDHGGGHYMIGGLTGPKAGVQGSIYIRMSVDGSQCTTDGSAPNGSNDYQTFLVTP